MRRVSLIVTAALGLFAVPYALAAADCTTHGITADGRVVTALPDAPRPWGGDITRLVTAKRMPPSLQARHVGGEAFCRVILNVRSGTVRDVVIVRSSGYPELDATIVQTLRQWKLKPGRWREFEVYVGLWPNKQQTKKT